LLGVTALIVMNTLWFNKEKVSGNAYFRMPWLGIAAGFVADIVIHV